MKLGTKKIKALSNIFFIILFGLAFHQSSFCQTIPFSTETWSIDAQGVIIDGYEGEENTLLLQNGRAQPNGVTFQNGIIEFDVFLAKRRGFPGILFRMEDEANYEEFYLRPHQSGNPDAMQYLPVFNGTAPWQLYHDQGAAVQDGRVTWRMLDSKGYNTIYTYPYDRWLHVRMVVSGSRLDVYFDHEEVPTLQVREMKRESIAGPLCLKASTCPVYFANFSVQKMESPPISSLQADDTEKVKNPIEQWHITSAFDEGVLEKKYRLDKDFMKAQSWQTLKSEDTGLCNIAQLKIRKSRKENTVLAKTIINSSIVQTKRIDFGYSDRVKVYCNGQLMYSGTNGFRTRDYRYLGTIGYFDSVYLPLKKGENEINFAVSESFGGWGIQAKLEDMNEIESIK